jgi:hypothetical protein
LGGDQICLSGCNGRGRAGGFQGQQDVAGFDKIACLDIDPEASMVSATSSTVTLASEAAAEVPPPGAKIPNTTTIRMAAPTTAMIQVLVFLSFHKFEIDFISNTPFIFLEDTD